MPRTGSTAVDCRSAIFWRGAGALGAACCLWLVAGLGCQAAVAPEASASPEALVAKRSDPAKAAKKGKPAAASASKVKTSRFAGAQRVIAIADLHGDWHATRQVFRLAGAIDQNDKWVGKGLVVVQTGDQLDRGNGEQLILDHLTEWQQAAKQQGGALHVLSGNHETMNVLGDYRYVTPGGFVDFEDAIPKSERILPDQVTSRLPVTMQARAAAFVPGGVYARKLSNHPVVAVVGDTLFAHGGVREAHLAYGIDRLNAEVKRWMQGKGKPPSLVLNDEGPVWTRYLSAGAPGRRACAELRRVLERTGTRRMVVGHTVQKGGISSACDNKVWRIDVGMAAHYGSSSVQALEITSAGVKVLRATKQPTAAAAE